MRHRSYTILILPQAVRRFRKVHVSVGFLLAVAGLGGVLVLAGLLAPNLWLELRNQSARVNRMEQENGQLRAERDRFETALAEMEHRVVRFESQTFRLARELGVEDLASAAPAAGGAVEPAPVALPLSWFDDEVRALSSRADSLDQSLSRLDEAFEDRARLLATTPSMMPVEGFFSHGYGWRKDPITGEREFHRGMDIVAPTGTEIRSPADGVVLRAGRFSDYGKSLDISHGPGFVTRYGHMSEILVQTGEQVRRSDVIGRVGSTGRSTGPHLHYEVFRDGRPVNPWKYLGQAG